MPEGHKTHFIAREHSQLLAGDSLRVTSPQGRFRADARKVSGQALSQVTAVGKHLFYEFENDRIVHVHLGRYGKFRVHDAPPPQPVGKVRVRMVGTHSAIDLNGPTTCRVIDMDEKRSVISKLGPDPLAGGRKADVWANICKSKKPIGALLLDQRIVAGVGNIFRAEILFEIGMNPQTPGCELEKSDFDALWKSLTKMMKTGLRYGRIISVTPREAGMPLSKVQGKDRFRVYGNYDCPECGQPIETIEVAARKLYWCSRCQQ